MFGIELKWFILFAVIILGVSGIDHRLKQIKNEIKNGFFEIKQVIQSPWSNEPIGVTLSTIGEQVGEINSIIDTLNEIKDTLDKERG